MKLEQDQVEQAAKALLAFLDKKSKTDKTELLPDKETAYLWITITTKRIPAKLRVKPIGIPLKHSILPPTAEVCLITKDPQSQFKQQLKDAGETRIDKVIGVSKLKAKFQAFEAKRQLCDSYDLFLADASVLPVLPRVLGKAFFKKKKLPVPIDLKKKDVSREISQALGSTYLHLTTGVCNALKVGKDSLTLKQNVENIMHCVQGAVDKIPGKWNNIQSIHLKSSTSVALPLFNALPDNDIIDDDEDESESNSDE